MDNKPRILVFGAGVLGSLYAAKLHEAGQNVSLLARGRRLEELRQHGVILSDTVSGTRATVRFPVVETLGADDLYDLIMVFIRKNQLTDALPALAINRYCPTFLFMLNNTEGPAEMIEALGAARVILGFPGAGGHKDGPVIQTKVVASSLQSTTIGELDGKVTPRLRQVAAMLRSARLPVAICNNMDAWLKTHVAIVSPIANALYMVGGDNRALAHHDEALGLMVDAVREGFQVLRALGIPLTPGKVKALEWLPKSLLLALVRPKMASPEWELIMARHANAARDEMKQLAEEFHVLAKASGVKTPALDRLYSYV